MSDNELLFAISNMMDKKLSSELQPIKEELQKVEGRLQSLEQKVHQISLCHDIDMLKKVVAEHSEQLKHLA